ncbi:HEPN domain-containing protein [Pedobacter nyackensis]|uniref:HEPN domain-containing protein n=1 Tax=Pedobacter nyackensis TaxID=475255 RepID=UPI00292FCC45|nr:HEPN domain-containing protein [Pedobacter nyackensis]
MNVRIIVPMENFALDQDTIIEFGQFRIFHGSRIKSDLEKDKIFMEKVGTKSAERVVNRYIIFYDGNIFDLTDNKDLTPEQIFKTILHQLTTCFAFLWAIKDNCVTLNSFFMHMYEKDDVSIMRTNLTFSTYSGELVNKPFSNEDLSLFGLLHPKLGTIMSWTDEQIKQIETQNPQDSIITTPANFLEYNKSRVARAMDFILLARSISFLISKISFNISAFECLFTSYPTEVTHKVCERASIFIGGNADEKIANYEAINEAYTVRSKYLHGNIIKHTRDKLIALSAKTDELLRFCIVKITNENDELFQMPETEGNIKKFENHFKNMLFNQ